MFRKIKISLLYTSVILLSLSITNIFATNTQQEIELKTNINLQTQVYKLDTKYRNIVFDLGGVLASFNIKKTIASLQATGKNIPQKVIEKLASIPHLPEHLEYNRGVLSKELYYKKIAEKLFPDKKNHHFVAEIHDAADDDLKIDPHALVLLSTLKAHGYKTYLLSNLVPAAEQHILKQDPSFFAQFDGAIFSYKIKAIKPEPAIYNALFKTYNLIPDECLFIDDMEINIQGGKALGMDGIVFSSIDQVLIDLIHLGVLPTSGKEFQGQIERARNMNEQNKKIICHDIHNNKKEVDSDQLIFRPSVYGILIENNQVLLSK
ncbi:MAG: HAD family phosphatase, partial [Candidatus Babeliales bacterium]